MKNLYSTLLLGTALAALTLTGCVVRERHYARGGVVHETTVVTPGVVASGEVIVSGAPPPLRVEVQSRSPGPYYVWVPGAWTWNGRWVWTAGYWDRPPRQGAVWVPHRYQHRNGVHVWVRGGWQ